MNGSNGLNDSNWIWMQWWFLHIYVVSLQCYFIFKFFFLHFFPILLFTFQLSQLSNSLVRFFPLWLFIHNWPKKCLSTISFRMSISNQWNFSVIHSASPITHSTAFNKRKNFRIWTVTTSINSTRMHWIEFQKFSNFCCD